MAKKVEGKKVIQSFLSHIMNFELDGRTKEVRIPAQADASDFTPHKEECYETIGNVVIVTDEIYDLLEKDGMFSHLVKAEALKVLDKVPEGYVSADKISADSKAATAEAVKRAEEAEAQNAAKDKEIEELKLKLKGFGA